MASAKIGSLGPMWKDFEQCFEIYAMGRRRGTNSMHPVSAVNDDELDRIRGRVAIFEDIIAQAQREQFAADAPEVADAFLQNDPIIAWRLLELFDAFRSGSVYTHDRLS